MALPTEIAERIETFAAHEAAYTALATAGYVLKIPADAIACHN